MVNAWSLAASVLNGTLDEDYPIMITPEDERAVADAKKKNPDKSDAYFDWSRNGLTENPFKDNDNIDIITGLGNTADTITITGGDDYAAAVDSLVDDMPLSFNTFADNDDSISHHIGLNTSYSDTLNIDLSGIEGINLSDDVVTFGRDTKPEPDLSFKSQKYQEDKGIKDLKDYVSSTYRGHYTNKNSDTQTLDLIHSVGDAESFCRSNALKYLSRYDKKGTAKQDILKAMHYCLLLYYFSGNTKDPDYTISRYETF